MANNPWNTQEADRMVARTLARALSLPHPEIIRAALLAARASGRALPEALRHATAIADLGPSRLADTLAAWCRGGGQDIVAALRPLADATGASAIDSALARHQAAVSLAPDIPAPRLPERATLAQQVLGAYLAQAQDTLGLVTLVVLCTQPDDPAEVLATLHRWPEVLPVSVIALLAELRDPRALPVLQRQWELGAGVEPLLAALSRLGDAAATPILLGWLRSPGAGQRQAALRRALAAAPPGLGKALVEACAGDADLCGQESALLVSLAGAAAAPWLVPALRSRFRHVREGAVGGLVALASGGQADPALPGLLALLDERPEPEVQACVLSCLAAIPARAAQEALEGALVAANWRVRHIATQALGARNDGEAVGLLARVIADPHPLVRTAARHALVQLGHQLTPAALPGLFDCAQRGAPLVAECAATLLERSIGGALAPALENTLAERMREAPPDQRERLVALRTRLESRLAEVEPRAPRTDRPVAADDSRADLARRLRLLCASVRDAQDFDHALHVAGQRLCDLLRAERFTVYGADASAGAITSKSMNGLNLNRPLKLPIAKFSIAGYAALTRQALTIADAYDAAELQRHDAELRFLKEVDKRTGYRTREMIVVPLVGPSSGKLVGVFQLLNHRTGGPFPGATRDLLVSFCEELTPIREARWAAAPNRFARLVADGVMSAPELERAEQMARATSRSVEAVLEDEFQLPRAVLGAALARHFGVPYEPHRPERARPSQRLQDLRREFVVVQGWLPVEEGAGGVVVACIDPTATRDSRLVQRLYPAARIDYRVTTTREFMLGVDLFFGKSDGPHMDDRLSSLSDEEGPPPTAPPTPARPGGLAPAPQPSDAGDLAIPAPISDQVFFTVTAPMTVAPGQTFVLDVWAHLEGNRQQVLARALEEQAGRPLRSKTRGAAAVERGKQLDVQVNVPELGFADADAILWTGTMGNATFALAVPGETPRGTHVGTARIAVDGLQVARLHFEIEVGSVEGVKGERTLHERRPRSAFASYASEDRDEVLARIQGMQKLLPDLDLFFDIASLRAAENWAKRLEEEIAGRDTLYLFWSAAAARSPWVEQEWRAALRLHGIDSIDPVSLDSPRVAPPPAELEAHFNEWTLAYRGRG